MPFGDGGPSAVKAHADSNQACTFQATGSTRKRGVADCAVLEPGDGGSWACTATGGDSRALPVALTPQDPPTA